jgi:hypothetical protein
MNGVHIVVTHVSSLGSNVLRAHGAGKIRSERCSVEEARW